MGTKRGWVRDVGLASVALEVALVGRVLSLAWADGKNGLGRAEKNKPEATPRGSVGVMAGAISTKAHRNMNKLLVVISPTSTSSQHGNGIIGQDRNGAIK